MLQTGSLAVKVTMTGMVDQPVMPMLPARWALVTGAEESMLIVREWEASTLPALSML